MAPPKRQSLRSFLAEEFAGIDAKFAGIDAKFAGIDAKFAGIDEKFAGIDAKFAGIDKQFVGVNAQFVEVNAQLKKIDAHLDKQDADLEHRTLSILQTIEARHQDARLWSSKLFALVDQDLKLHREEHAPRGRRGTPPSPAAEGK